VRPIYIDTDDYEASGIEVFTFPGGEYHANVPKWPTHIVHIHAKLRTWRDVGKLLVVADALSSQGVTIYLFAPYFPGLRQDRNPDGLTPLTSRIYGKLLGQIARAVTFVDPHSNVAESVISPFINTMRTIDTSVFLPDLIEDKPTHVLCPDEGAKVRSEATAALFGAEVIYAEKKRDFGTGKLSGFRITSKIRTVDNRRVLLADDICDGGGTFVGLLEEFRKQSAAPVDLYVTHGIFSKGVDVLDGFDHVYTTDSFYRARENSRVKYITLIPYYFGGLRP
jgi:ribose-phosphate pyrophosphokinase